MNLNISNIRAGLETNLSTISGFQVSRYMLSNFTPPAIMIRPDNESAIEYGQAMGGGVKNIYMTVVAYVGTASDIGAQKLLDNLIDDDLVIDAIESDKTLAGACADLDVRECRAYQEYARPDGSTVLGAEWTVFIIAGP
ncbi:MAG TPA: hypothetical protein VNN79_04350 [Actinomycetota bacterium]|nr:hypothetical protein [Actinomycetota bacterium]